jgi:hypothetical protein
VSDGVFLPSSDPDAIARAPLNIRRADAMSARHRRQSSYPRTPMSNVRPVDAATQARWLADFFTRGHVANVPAVEAANLRQVVADRTPDIKTRSGEPR